MKKKKSPVLDFEIGKRCAYARRAAGYTQEHLAELLDLSVQYISDMERGKTGMSTLTIVKLCKTLEVSADFILIGFNTESSESEEALTFYRQMKCLSESERKLIESLIKFLTRYFISHR